MEQIFELILMCIFFILICIFYIRFIRTPKHVCKYTRIVGLVSMPNSTHILTYQCNCGKTDNIRVHNGSKTFKELAIIY